LRFRTSLRCQIGFGLIAAPPSLYPASWQMCRTRSANNRLTATVDGHLAELIYRQVGRRLI